MVSSNDVPTADRTEACIELSGMPPIGSHSDMVDRLAEAVVVLTDGVVVWASACAIRQNMKVVAPSMVSIAAWSSCWPG